MLRITGQWKRKNKFKTSEDYMVSKLFLSLSTVLWALPVLADEPKFDAEARAKAIAPYLDGQAIAIAHLDVSRLNADALIAKIIEVTRRNAEDFEPFKTKAVRWITDFTKAGGKEVYLVFNLADLPGPPFVIVPLADRANAAAIAESLHAAAADLGYRGVSETLER